MELKGIGADVPPAVVMVKLPAPATGKLKLIRVPLENTSGPVFDAVSRIDAEGKLYVELFASTKPRPDICAVFVPLTSSVVTTGTICSSGAKDDPTTCSANAPLKLVGMASVADVPFPAAVVGLRFWTTRLPESSRNFATISVEVVRAVPVS